MRQRAIQLLVGLVLGLRATAARCRPSLLAPRRAGLAIRGGETAAEPEADDVDADARARRTWLVEQVRRRQERVLVFSKALAERGLNFGDGTTANPPPRLMVEAPDWLVARASEEAPRSCLIWGDALEDTAVVRPRKARGQWVSLSALNNLRRLEPAKASKLWYDRYALDLRRLNAESGPAGVLLGSVLDSRRAARGLTLLTAALVLALARPLLAVAAVAGLTSRVCWTNYALWSPLVHAPLPLKLLVVRQAYVWAVSALRALELLLRKGLVELESRALEAGVRESVLDEGEDE